MQKTSIDDRMADSYTSSGIISRNKSGYPKLRVRDLDLLIEQIAEDYLSAGRSEEGVIITITPVETEVITPDQLGYIYGHLGILALRMFLDDGFTEIQTKETAVEWMKVVLDFGNRYDHPISGESIFVPLSLSKAAETNRARINDFIRAFYLHLHNRGFQPKTLKQWSPYKYQLKEGYSTK